MYHVEKHPEEWTIHNDDNGRSRPLAWQEMMLLIIELPELRCEQVSTVYVRDIFSVERKP